MLESRKRVWRCVEEQVQIKGSSASPPVLWGPRVTRYFDCESDTDLFLKRD